MAEAREILILLGKGDTYADVYLELVRRTREVLDGYFWLKEKEAQGPGRAAGSHPCRRQRRDRRVRQGGAPPPGDRLAHRGGPGRHRETSNSQCAAAAPDDIRGFVRHLADLRLRRGEIIGLRELRYADNALIDDLDQRAADAADGVSARTVEFLLRPNRRSIPTAQAIETQRESLAEDHQDRRSRRHRQGTRRSRRRTGTADRHRQQPAHPGRHPDHRDHRERFRDLRHAQRRARRAENEAPRAGAVEGVAAVRRAAQVVRAVGRQLPRSLRHARRNAGNT